MSEYYLIQVVEGLSSDRCFLSCAPDGRVDLWNQDDGSGRQRWVLDSVGPTGSKREICFTISPLGGVPGPYPRLTAGADNRSVSIAQWQAGPPQPQLWILHPVPVTTPDNDYFIRLVSLKDGNASAYLGCSADGSVVDLSDHDDRSGRQRWQLQGPYTAS